MRLDHPLVVDVAPILVGLEHAVVVDHKVVPQDRREQRLQMVVFHNGGPHTRKSLSFWAVPKLEGKGDGQEAVCCVYSLWLRNEGTSGTKSSEINT